MTFGFWTEEATAEANDSIKEFKPNMRSKVLRFLYERGGEGATDHEIQRELKMNESTERPRRIELADMGLIVPSGFRPTATGRKATVWVMA